MRKVYFDNAATTAIRPEVVEEMSKIMLEVHGNPSSTHSFGRSAKSLLEKARKSIAAHLNVTAGEIVFTSGGTEADNMVLTSAVRDLGVKRIITSKIEHHAVLHTAQYLEQTYGITLSYVDLKKCGTPDIAHLEELLQTDGEKTLVSLMHINNEVGNKIDLAAVAKICKAANALFHSDMVQSIGHFELDLKNIPVDFAAVSAHKFHGPKGAGFAFIRKGSGLKAQILGGEQERGFRAGTESVHNIVGMEKALDMSYANLDQEKAYVQELKEYFITQLKKHIPQANLNGNCENTSLSTYTLINVCLPLDESQALMLPFQLDLHGIACSKGSACQSGSGKGSHVLAEILTEEDQKKPSIRFSFSIFNTKEEVDYVIDVLNKLVSGKK
ncbi:cysteine desulfurase family protein [Gangjinia marincola]|uniref:cysteine desulfurase n=1 Tax=Gangjinia marincola TaxID=578463 RepID=A0ABP3XS36_9FLAO